MRTRTLSLLLFLSLLVAPLAGCQSVAIVDGIDLALDLNPLDGPSDSLHTPYVLGARMSLYVLSQQTRRRGLILESSDPSVFAVEAPIVDKNGEFLYAVGLAVGEGEAQLRVLSDSGALLHERTVSVRFPERVSLLAHGPLLVDRAELDPFFGEGQILTGGTSTYLARYTLGPDQLSGNGALSVTARSTGLGTRVIPTYLFEDRDWLQLSPQQSGPFELELSIGGIRFGTVTGRGVDKSVIADVAIYGEDESRAVRDQQLIALGHSVDSAGRPVYGVEYKWSLNGRAEPGMGDLFVYKYDPRKKGMLSAEFDGLGAEATIQGTSGYVSSSNFVGCRALPGGSDRGGRGVGAALLGLLFALAMKRRSAMLTG